MDIERKVQRLVDKDAIKELRARYCYHWDDRNKEEFVSLFTENAVFDLRGHDTDSGGVEYQGHDEIRTFFEEADPDAGRFWAHMSHNPLIEVNGDEATGKWYFEVPTTFPDGSAGWGLGKYDEAYRRVDDEWKFQRVSLNTYYNADYQEGWAEEVKNLRSGPG